MESENKKEPGYNIRDIGHETRFKPGQSGNPAGPPKVKVQFWRYVQQYSEMTTAEIEAINKDELTQSKLAAIRFVADMVAGDWQQVKEALDRDEGPIVKKTESKVQANSTLTHFHELSPEEAEGRAVALLNRTLQARQLQTGAIELLPGLPRPNVCDTDFATASEG